MSDASQLSDALAAYRAAVRIPDEEIVALDLDPLDRLGIPVASVGAWPDGVFCGGTGYGATREAATLSAWGELVEAALPVRSLRRMRRRRGSLNALRRAGVPALDPVRLCLPVTTAYTPDLELTWVAGRRYPSQEPVWVPVEFAAQGPEDLGPDDPAPADRLITPITNGMGAGDSLERALAHGLMELLQRDGNSVAYRALDRGIAIDLGTLADPALQAQLDACDAAGIEVTAKLAATDFGLTNLYVVGADREPVLAPHPLCLTACGEAAHPDREAALGKALREFASSRVRKAFTHGPLEPLTPLLPPGYLDRFRAAYTGIGEPRAYRAMRAWLDLDPAALLELTRPTLAVSRSVPLGSLPTAAPGSSTEPTAVLADLAGRLAAADLEILYVDFTPPGSPAHAVHVIVPGLEVETMTYYRIGPRNLRRLLERGVDFAGLGEPPPGAFRVPLTEADQAALGAPAWLDPAATDRAVGRLYPLYREPGRHVMELAATRQS